jgi:hypothetical protein
VNRFRHGEEYEERKDYEVKYFECEFCHYAVIKPNNCPDCKVIAVPLDPQKGEDDILKKFISILHHIESMEDCKPNEFEKKFERLVELRKDGKQFVNSITKKQ